MIILKLTHAQRSALECAGLDSLSVVGAAWDSGNTLALPDGTEAREELASEINELSNAEDRLAEELSGKRESECARGARGAALALANLYLKVLKSQNEKKQETT